MDTPVLLIHFNRPESTRRQLDALKSIAPKHVWILCDGPRAHKPGEIEKVNTVRALLDDLPWDCEVQRLYRETNLGCFKSVSDGISWFLNDCEAGIILEDDVLADASFFPYCEALLERYADQPQVFAVAGHHRNPRPLEMESDYGFSNYFECWGWATWRRAWEHFDPTISGWRDPALWNRICQRVLKKQRARFYWKIMFGLVDAGKRDSWAYRYMLTIWKDAGLVAIPSINLTENIGFTQEGTQTAHFAGMEVRAGRQRFPLKHPDGIEADSSIDAWFEDGIHSKSPSVRMKWLMRRIRYAIGPHR